MQKLTAALLPAFLGSLITGCALHPGPSDSWPPASQYHAPIVAATAPGSADRSLTIARLARQLKDSDVVVIGEYHGHHGAHLLQSRLQLALFKHNPNQVLALEAFNLDHQEVLDRYLAGEIGEGELIDDANGWPNYKASYRPLVEFARQHRLPVIAANAPAQTVRCVGRSGGNWLEQIDKQARDRLPAEPFHGTDRYRQRFFDAMGGHHSEGASERMQNSYLAQLLRDNTMATRILDARQQHPGHQIIHINGTFHSENRDGVVAALLHRQPDLRIAVISPVFVTDKNDSAMPVEANAGKGDYLYFLQPLPDEYLDPERYREAIRRQFRDAAEISCPPPASDSH